jgi:hypothetical protein
MNRRSFLQRIAGVVTCAYCTSEPEVPGPRRLNPFLVDGSMPYDEDFWINRYPIFVI